MGAGDAGGGGLRGGELDGAIRQGRAGTPAGLLPQAGTVPALPATDILQPVSSAAADLLARFPPRPAAAPWPATAATRQEVFARLLAPPFPLDNPLSHQRPPLALPTLLNWLHPPPAPTRPAP